MILNMDQIAKIKKCLNCDTLDCRSTLGCEIDLELKCINNKENFIKTTEYLYERVELLETALDKASQLLQDKGFEEESKAIDCIAEL